jgi:hypothetical protein
MGFSSSSKFKSPRTTTGTARTQDELIPIASFELRGIASMPTLRGEIDTRPDGLQLFNDSPL